MVHLCVSAPQEDAQRAAGYSLIEWQRFLILTRQEARACVEADPTLQWTYYTATQRHKVTENVMAALKVDGCGQITEDIIHWRMAKVIRDTVRARKSVSNTPGNSNSKPNGTEGKVSPISSTTNGANDTSPAPKPHTRAFDPIRDI